MSAPSHEDRRTAARVLRYEAEVCRGEIAQRGLLSAIWNWESDRDVLAVLHGLADQLEKDASGPPNAHSSTTRSP